MRRATTVTTHPEPAPGNTLGTATSADGTVIGFEVAGSGPPLVLVHGSSGTRLRWAGVAPALARRYRVYMVDRRGRGISAEEAGPYSLQREAEDIRAVAEAVGPDVYVVGHSFGALTVMEAAMLTNAFRRIMLYEPPFPSGEGTVIAPEALASIKATTDPMAIMTTFYEQTLHLPASALSALIETEFSKVAPTAARTIGRELDAVEAYRPSPRLAAIGVPVRLLLGTESPAYLKAATAMVAAQIPGATIVAFQGQGHQGVDDDPDQFTHLVLKFDSVESSPAR